VVQQEIHLLEEGWTRLKMNLVFEKGHWDLGDDLPIVQIVLNKPIVHAGLE
jgi:hypothetical protein